MASPFRIEETELACPYFMPVDRLENGSWPHPARLPLGCGWSGHCTAPGHVGEVPEQDTLEKFCNLGYAGNCKWAPAIREWDSVRFAVSAPPPRAGAEKIAGEIPSTLLRLSYVCEIAHRPAANGELLFDVAEATWVSRHSDARVQKMAECFLESYFKRKV